MLGRGVEWQILSTVGNGELPKTKTDLLFERNDPNQYFEDSGDEGERVSGAPTWHPPGTDRRRGDVEENS